MSRWEPEAANRLMEAAVLLFEEQGYDRTTVEEIAARAGLTKRTFFRHFADKREVLFGGGNGFVEAFAAGVRDAPADASPLEAVAAGAEAVTPMTLSWGDGARRRQTVIAASPELRERDLAKHAALAAAVTAALLDRGVDDLQATVVAEAGVAAFRVGFDRWVMEPGGDLAAIVRESIDTLRALAV